jgi:hypothetical protein
MPIEDMYDYVCTMIEDHMNALDDQEKIDFVRDCLYSEEAAKMYVDDHISLMVSDSVLKAAMLGSVDFGQLYVWIEESIATQVKTECEWCNKMTYDDCIVDRNCCENICEECINKHDEGCKDYENQKIQEETENKVTEYLALRNEACMYGDVF